MSSIIINNLLGIEDKTYLELGVDDGGNFIQIKSKIKESVDVNGNATYTGTTDEYFKSISIDKKFDIIFIDANHDWNFVERDFNNSIKHCNEWILMHDMIPPGRKYTKSYKCSDSYKVLYHLLTKTHFQIYPMNENFGVTLIKMPAGKINLTNEDKNLTFDLFTSFIKNQKLYSHTEIVALLGGKNV